MWITWLQRARAHSEVVWKSGAVEVRLQSIGQARPAASVKGAAVGPTWTHQVLVLTSRLQHLADEILTPQKKLAFP